MSRIVVATSQSRINTCPHGLPLGACPICNGMGGARSLKSAASSKRNSNEWTWMQCYMVGQMMKAVKSRQNQAMLVQREQNLGFKISNKVKNIVGKIQLVLNKMHKIMPTKLQSVFGKVINLVLNPVLNLLNTVPTIAAKIEQFVNDIKTMINSAVEKLSAVIGEVRNFINEKLYKRFKSITKKLLCLFVVDSTQDNYADDEELVLFKLRELRKIKCAILRQKKKGFVEDDITAN